MSVGQQNGKRLLPSNMQDFVKIREMGYVYVDKTARIHHLISNTAGACFLSRPRRFGKSLLCSTMATIFEGRREFFGEVAGQSALAIDSLDWKWEECPVIHIDFNSGDYPRDGLTEFHANVSRALETTARKYGIPLIGETHGDKFARLLQSLYEHTGKRVVVIIDEYDKPLLETIDKTEMHLALRLTLKGFYSILKPSDKYLRIAFITGVTKFAHVSIFSDLNHLRDLTLDPCYADICGFTQEEIENTFEPEISKILETTGKTRKDYMERLRTYYNGYRFTENDLKVYNSFGMLHHFDNYGKFKSYWYESGSPSFLVKLITEQKINILDLGEMTVDDDGFRKYDVEDMEAVPVLYQSGYLTITDYDDERECYTLDYPNIEVRSSFAKSLLRQYLNVPKDRSRALFICLPKAFEEGDIAGAIDALKQFLAKTPYDIIKETENYFQTVTHLIFSMLGLNCRSEVRIAAGRVDTTVATKNFMYCFEFKYGKTADEALAQIDTKDYLLPWRGDGKKLFKVGVNFDPETRNINEWKFESIEAEA